MTSDKRTFLIHHRDKKQPICPNGFCGGDSPNSLHFIFQNPVKSFVNIDTLKKYKTTHKGHLFTPLQLSPIIKSVIQLEDLLLLIDEIKDDYATDFIQEAIQNKQKDWFPFIINPQLNPSEVSEKERLLNNPRYCIFLNDRYFFGSDTSVQNPLIFIKDRNAIIRGNLPLSAQDRQHTLYTFLQKYPKVFWNLKTTIEQAEKFYQSKHPFTQQEYDSFWIRSQSQAKFYALYTRTVPLIIKLCENTRRIFFDTLIKHHWHDIADTPQKAGRLLKNDHNRIYRLAQQYHYTEGADFLISLEDQRNTVAHPDPFSGGELFSNPYRITDFFWCFLSNHTNLEQLTVYCKHNPVEMNTKVLNMLENNFHALRSDEMCLMYGKSKNRQEFPIKNKKVLATIKDDPIFTAVSNPVDNHQLRLSVAHGQQGKVISANIPENTLIQMQQSILFPNR